jgi:hypothetical protein
VVDYTIIDLVLGHLVIVWHWINNSATDLRD